MHLLIGTRGNKESVELFIKELSSKYVPLPMRNKKDGKIVNVVNPIHVQPFQIWSINFPKEQRDVILTTLFPEKYVFPCTKKLRQLYKWVLKFLPLKKIPKDWDASHKFYVNTNDVEIVGLGLKDDETQDFKRSDEAMKSIGLDPKEEWEFEAL